MANIQSFLEADRRSKLREQIVEYKFLSELFIYCASQNKELELLKSEHDSFGYDVVLKVGSHIKYIQLKSKKAEGKTAIWNIRKSLVKNNNGSVILIEIEYGDTNIELGYRILDENKKDTILRRATKEGKKWQCQINIGELKKVNSITELFNHLFMC